MHGYGERLRAIWAARELTPMQTLILLVINDFAGGEGSCFASRDAIAAKAHCSTRTVARFLGELTDAGILQRKPRFSPDGERLRSDELVVDWSRLDALAAKSRRNETPLLDVLDASESAASTSTDAKIDNCAMGDTVSPQERHRVTSEATRCHSPPKPPFSFLNTQRTSNEHTTATTAPPPFRDRVCVSLIDRFFGRVSGVRPTISAYTAAELRFAAELLDTLGVDEAFRLLDRVADDVRRTFPACKHFTGTRRSWDRAIAARAQIAAQNAARKADAAAYNSAMRQAERKASERRELLQRAKSAFAGLSEAERGHWLAEARRQLPPPVRNTAFAQDYAAQMALARQLEASQ